MDRKEAIEIVKSNFPNGMSRLSEALMILIPELKENDNRIRKELIEHFKWNAQILSDFDNKDVIAWLEKQDDVDKSSYEIAEKEKNDFVSGQLIECRKSFDDFQKGNNYRLEYVGNNNYIGRSDNIFNKKFHITPRQLFTSFSQQSKKETKNKCPNYQGSWGCATSPLKQCNVCPDYKLYN